MMVIKVLNTDGKKEEGQQDTSNIIHCIISFVTDQEVSIDRRAIATHPSCFACFCACKAKLIKLKRNIKKGIGMYY